MTPQTKRYKTNSVSYATRDRQLSGLFTIISNNLLLAAELLGTECDIETIRKIGALSSESRKIAAALLQESDNVRKDQLIETVSNLKLKILALVAELSRMLAAIDSKQNAKKSVQDLIFVRKLLRESQRGLATVQDVA